MNKAAQQLGRLGGLAPSEANAAANRAKAAAFWEDKRAKRSPNAGREARTARAG